MKSIIKSVAGVFIPALALLTAACGSSVVVSTKTAPAEEDCRNCWFSADSNTLKLDLNPRDILRLRLCKGTIVIFDTVNGSRVEPYFSELQPMAFFNCPCRDERMFKRGYFYFDSTFEKGLALQLNTKKTIPTNRSSEEVLLEDAVSLVNFVLPGINSGNRTFGYGAMMIPKKPILFDPSTIKWASVYNNFNSIQEVEYVGHNFWQGIFDPVPMNVAFGRPAMDLNLVRATYPIVWETINVKEERFNQEKLAEFSIQNKLNRAGSLPNGSQGRYFRLLVIRNRDLLEGIDLSYPMTCSEYVKRAGGKGMVAKGIQSGDILEIILSEEIIDDRPVYNIFLMSHHFIEEASRGREAAIIPVGNHVSLPHYPNVEPYYVNINDRIQPAITNTGIQLFLMSDAESFRYKYLDVTKQGMEFKSGFPQPIETMYLQPKSRKKTWCIRLNRTENYRE